MGKFTKLATTFTIIAGVFFLLAMTTPWWYTKLGNQDRTNCFIDGTCRRDGKVWKDNFQAQEVYDSTTILMVLAWFPFMLYIHLLSFRIWRVYSFPGRKTTLLVSGVICWLLIFVAVVVFAWVLPDKLGYDTMYGDRPMIDPNTALPIKLYWGIHVAWYFAICTLIALVPSIIFSRFIKGTKKSSVLLPKKETRTTVYGTVPTAVEAH